MRKGLVAALAGSLMLVAVGPASALRSRSADRVDAVVFAAGGTPLTNGYFFPGTAIHDGYEFSGEPLPVQRGSNVRFVNLDHSTVTNGHQIRSFKRRAGRPLFQSKYVDGPGETTMLTSHLKPGVYYYFCPVHTTMYGGIRIVD